MKKVILVAMSALLALASCTREEHIGDTGETSNITKVPAEKRNLPCLVRGAVYEGEIRIRVTEEMAAEIESYACQASATAARTSNVAMNKALDELGAVKLERIFSNGGKYEKRRRKAGLHLWYRVAFDENIEVMAAANRLAVHDGVTLIEGVPYIDRVGGSQEPLVATQELIKSLSAGDAVSPSAAPVLYNDPHLKYQWHYYNDGSRDGFVAGADINLFPAWEIESGNREVIVSIVDGGFDYTHVDLAGNVWINDAEKNGSPRTDDDGNGYMDDIYGFNFVTNSGSIVPEAHGTHVAGTIAAVNNNGIGVSGVAGGDGTPGSGVRIMSCQVFQKLGGFDRSGNFADAIVYGADNGAVISQNSWGMRVAGPLPEAEKDAIDYFISYAGTDEEGLVQVGPMKGGIVIFAAGNENTNGLMMPGAYEKCFAVAGMAPDFTRAWYSNYGDWVQITAPGGDENYGQEGWVYSTLTNNLYGWMQGTSMACPHVSGIAALAVSKYGVGKPGFTNGQLWDLLSASTHDIYKYNPTYLGQLGSGYIDAYKTLAKTGGLPPQPVSDLEIFWTFEGAYLSWSVTSDPDSGQAARYDILWGESNLSGTDFDNPPAGTRKQIARVNGKAAGEKISARIVGMELGKTYYISIAAADSDGNRSAAHTESGVTEANRAPMVLNIPETITLASAEYREIPIEVLDLEGYKWTYSLTAGSGALKVRKENDEGLILVFDCIKANTGSYTATLNVKDEQGLDRNVAIPYTIRVNNAPKISGAAPEFVINGVNITKEFDLTQLFTDEDNDVLSYEVRSSDPSLASISNADGKLTAKSLKFGSAQLTITGVDPRGESARTTVSLVCRNTSRQVDLYPVPVRKDGILNIRMGEDVEGTIEVTLFNTANGAKVFNERVAISPSNPAKVNIGSLSAGAYRVVVRFGDMEVTKNITKL